MASQTLRIARRGLIIVDMITLRLLLAHMLGDYVLQTGRIAQQKTQGWSGLLWHVGIVTLTSIALTADILPFWGIWSLVLGGLHLAIDQVRAFRARSLPPEFSCVYLLLDQSAHVVTICGVAYIAARETPLEAWQQAQQPATRWLALAILIIFLIWTTAILEMEVVRSLRALRQQVQPAQVLPLDRLFGAVERLTAVTLFLSPYPLLYISAFVPRMWWHLRYRLRPGPLLECEVRALVSALSATAVGLAIAFLLG